MVAAGPNPFGDLECQGLVCRGPTDRPKTLLPAWTNCRQSRAAQRITVITRYGAAPTQRFLIPLLTRLIGYSVFALLSIGGVIVLLLGRLLQGDHDLCFLTDTFLCDLILSAQYQILRHQLSRTA